MLLVIILAASQVILELLLVLLGKDSAVMEPLSHHSHAMLIHAPLLSASCTATIHARRETSSVPGHHAQPHARMVILHQQIF
jgi:hypothetical protein